MFRVGQQNKQATFLLALSGMIRDARAGENNVWWRLDAQGRMLLPTLFA
jgi:hypothetical protein